MKRSDVNPVEESSSATSLGLVHGAQANDQQAWQRLVELYSRRMYRWCRLAGLQPADASNVVQEALQSVVRHIADFRRDRPGDTFRGWLRRITDNKIRDHYRRAGRTLEVAAGGTDALGFLANLAHRQGGEHDDVPCVDVEQEQVPQDQALNEATWDTTQAARQGIDVQQQIARVREGVSPRDWRFFWRVAVDGQSAVDVAHEFGVTANAVRLVKMRVLRKLRAGVDKATIEPTRSRSSSQASEDSR